MILEILMIDCHHALLCKCDECDIKFIDNRYLKRYKQYHFCSRLCSNKSQKSGVLAEQVRETNLKKFGVQYPTQNFDVMKKQHATNLERYGAKSQLIVAAKQLAEKCGVENVSQIPYIRKKILETFDVRYGGHPFKDKAVKEKIKKTNNERYGVDWPLMSHVIIAKVDHVSRMTKRHETMKKSGHSKKSKQEKIFENWLIDQFGVANVISQIPINGWSIDFYVKSIDTYIQFDGTYWHGHDRQLEEIQKFKSQRDVTICGTVLRDKMQNEHFVLHDLKLVRIDENEWKFIQKKNDYYQILVRLNSSKS
jgi:G:T-mismatch repair DNA endonuclease (very short patch repair protein)